MKGLIELKKSGVVYLGKSKFLTLMRENLIIVIFTLIFTFGVLCACLLFNYNHFENESDLLLNFFVQLRCEFNFLRLFVSSFFLSFIFLFLIYLFGTSLLGLAFVPFVLFVRGAISGLLLCGLYSEYSLTGIAVNLLTVIPSTLISVLALIDASGHSLTLSYSLGKMIINEGQAYHKIDIKLILKKFCLHLFIITLGALFEAFMSFLFNRFLVLG